MNPLHTESPETSQHIEDSGHRRLFRVLSRLRREQTPPAADKIRNRRTWNRALIGAWSFFLIFVVAVIILAFHMRHAMQAALPQIDGNFAVSGLTAPVTVTRDAQGVPSITADGLDDLLFAQGFVTAQDRLFQMDTLRRHGTGELAEILGSSLVDHDRQQRILQLRTAADRAVSTLPPDQLHQLEAYARGVNAFIATHTETLPVEFHLLHYTPAPWSPRDSLLIVLVMSQDLTTSFPQKLNREAFSAHLPPELLADLYPVGSWRDRPPTQTEFDLTTPTEEIEQIPLDKTQSRNAPASATPHDLLATSDSFSHASCEACRSGSNNWAVAGAHTASGMPLLSNDMHLGLTAPDIWYEAALHAATTPDGRPLDVAGMTLPGAPFVIVGRNANVAWGLTNTGSDVQDVRIEHMRGSGPNTEFQLPNGTWTLAGHQVERIRVRAGRDVTLDVLTTSHSVGEMTMVTPVISPLYPSERRALSLAWNIYDPANVTFPTLAIDTAVDAASLVAAFAGLGGPSMSVVYADAHHIGFHVIGRVPIRGPAVQRPRVTQPFIMPDRTPDSDDEDESGESQTSALQKPHLQNVAFYPKTPSAVNAQAAREDQIPAQPTTPYTIGSPISPLPVDALDATQAWSGYIPYNELPSVLDPDSGVLATANARVTTDDYPYFLNDNWADPYRVERIQHLLAGRSGLHAADMLAIQTDLHSELDLMIAQRLAYALDHAANHNDKRLHQAADLLRDWNGDMTADSPAAAIVATTRSTLWPMLLTPQIDVHDHGHERRGVNVQNLVLLYTWGEKNSALEQILLHQPTHWLPSGYANWNDFLAASVNTALSENQVPADLKTWRYGTIHPVEIAHPIFGSKGTVARLLGKPTGTGMRPTGGDATTVKAAGLHFGPSERFTADLSDADATLANITTGQSGNPASPWFLDQFLPWLHGTTFAIPLHHPAVSHTLTLTPQ